MNKSEADFIDELDAELEAKFGHLEGEERFEAEMQYLGKVADKLERKALAKRTLEELGFDDENFIIAGKK